MRIAGNPYIEPKLRGRLGHRVAATVLLILTVVSVRNVTGATFVVVNTSDAGAGSFRQSLLDANASPGLDTIAFAIPGTGIRSITPATALPPVLDPVLIDGASQPGYNEQPLIELNGTNAGSTAGLRILCGNSIVRGLTIDRFAGSGIQIEGPGTNVIQGNRIGTDASGTVPRPNGLEGVWVYNSSGNQIGGTGSGEGNLISGNSDSGIYIQNGSGNCVLGNFIGVNAAGTGPLGNGNNGITCYNAPGNIIGGSATAGRNVISGNRGSGVYLNGSGASGNSIQGNFVGTGKGGAGTISNAADGVTINGAAANWIGGIYPGQGNLISGNGKAGIAMIDSGAVSNNVLGNLIGTDYQGRSALGNAYAGITIAGGISNVIGGSILGARNIISGNKQDGVFLSTNSIGNLIAGNYIGVDITGAVSLSNLFNGISVTTANSNVIGGRTLGERNTISGNAIYGIQLSGGAFGNVVLGNFIGPAASGVAAVANGRSGVRVESANNSVGAVAAGNVLSGNRLDGLVLVGPSASNNTVRANLVGTAVDGATALANGRSGIGVSGAAFNVIGGANQGDGNVLSGNAEAGVYLIDPWATRNTIEGNLIGTDASGNSPLGNGWEGIYLQDCSANTIGGTLPGCGNVISANRTRGLFLTNSCWNAIQGNLIGTKRDGFSALGNAFHNIELEAGSTNNIIGGVGVAANTVAYAQTIYAGIRVRDRSLNNRISQNLVFGNGALGIDLGPVGANSNDNCDADTGANNLQNFPVLNQAVSAGCSVAVRGSFNSAVGHQYTLEFFASAGCDPGGNGQGQIFVGETSLTLDGACEYPFTAVLPMPVPAGCAITATATDPAGNTSEFSPCTVVWSAPSLSLQASARGEFILSWPAFPAGFVLKQTGSLNPPVIWESVTNEVQLINGTCQTALSSQSGNRFFALCWE